MDPDWQNDRFAYAAGGPAGATSARMHSARSRSARTARRPMYSAQYSHQGHHDLPSGRCSSVGGASWRADTVRSTWPGPGGDDTSSDGFAAGSAQYVARTRRRKWDGPSRLHEPTKTQGQPPAPTGRTSIEQSILLRHMKMVHPESDRAMPGKALKSLLAFVDSEVLPQKEQARIFSLHSHNL
mmetsp:Transcript_73790/g.130078  ORF Transcript_73790/g.130078 Transcript_73790/m.130078 type:complete len:183 (+) Transcript_73790:107-655(+)